MKNIKVIKLKDKCNFYNIVTLNFFENFIKYIKQAKISKDMLDLKGWNNSLIHLKANLVV